jgi:hypothetical protein
MPVHGGLKGRTDVEKATSANDCQAAEPWVLEGLLEGVLVLEPSEFEAVFVEPLEEESEDVDAEEDSEDVDAEEDSEEVDAEEASEDELSDSLDGAEPFAGPEPFRESLPEPLREPVPEPLRASLRESVR